MRIAFLTTEYPTENTFAGGVASYTQRTAGTLAKLGQDVEVFTLSDAVGTILDNNVVIHRVPICRWGESLAKRLPIIRRSHLAAKIVGRSWALARCLRRRHHDEPFDLIQAVSNFGSGLCSTVRPVCPVITFAAAYRPAVREAQQLPLTMNDRQCEWAEAKQIKRSHGVFAPSELVARRIQTACRLPVHVIEYAYDLKPLTRGAWPPPDDFPAESYGLFFGGINRLKGCDRLARILPQFLHRHPKAFFLFVGRVHSLEGLPSDEFLRQRLGEFASQVAVLPPQRPDALFRYVANARFVVLPSRMDNLPNAAIEAMALGRLLIATRDASFEQLIIDGQNGLLVSQEDDEQLLQALSDAWTMDTAQRHRLGDAATLTVERFSPERAIQPLLALYHRTIAVFRS